MQTERCHNPREFLRNKGATRGSLMGVQVMRGKRLISLYDKRGPESRRNEVKLRPPLCRPLKQSMVLEIICSVAMPPDSRFEEMF